MLSARNLKNTIKIGLTQALFNDKIRISLYASQGVPLTLVECGDSLKTKSRSKQTNVPQGGRG